MEMFHAADNGKCSGLYDDGVPKHNLRAHQFTGADGRYAFTTITPSAYAEPLLAAVEGIAEVCAPLGRRLYPPARIHFEVHHPDLIAPWAGEIYFKGDPVIPVDFVGAKKAPLSLQADSVLHENPQDVAGAGFQNPYRTLEFDSVLKAHTPAPTPSARRGRRHEPRGRDRLVAVPAQHRLLPPRRPPRTRRSAGTLDALYEVHGRTLRGHAEIPHALYARPGPEQQTSRHIPGVTHFRTVGAATAQGTIPLLGYGGLTPTRPGPAPCTVATGGHIFELSNHYQLGSGSWKIAHRTARQILTPVRD